MVNLDTIQAIVTHNRVYVFLPDGADSKGLASLVKQLTNQSDKLQKYVPFEFRTLEAIFISALCNLEAVYEQMRPNIKEILSALGEEVKIKGLKELRK